MNTPIHGAQRGEWPEPNRRTNVPPERTDRTRTGQEDPREVAPQAFDAAQLASAAAAARARQGAGVSPTVDAEAVTASIVAAEAAAKARLAAATKPRNP